MRRMNRRGGKMPNCKRASESFERKEMKYRLSAGQLAALLTLVREHLKPTEFADSTITSVYYDTPTFELIERSLEKPLYKEKLRLRVYGDSFEASMRAFVELKKKYKGIVYKRRMAMSLQAALAYLSGTSFQDACAQHPLQDSEDAPSLANARSMQIAREVDFFMQRHASLAPSMLIACERLSFADEASGLRITFDARIRALPFPLGPAACAKYDAACLARAASTLRAMGVTQVGQSVIGPGEAIMEVKCQAGLPFWLVDALSELGAYQQSFSKYGTAYLNMLAQQRVACERRQSLPNALHEPIRVIWPQAVLERTQQLPVQERMLHHA